MRALRWLALSWVPVVGVVVGSSVAADRLADEAARELAEVTEGWFRAPDRAPAEAPVETALAGDPEPSSEPVAQGAPPSEMPRAAPRRVRVVPRKGIRVRAPRVLSLANGGARPSGAYVPATASRPAGLVLHGVSALGVGLQDGDVLTHAAGQSVRSPGQVIGLVIGARAKRATELSGIFWRGGEPWQLIVEQPYVGRQKRPPSRKRVARVARSTRSKEATNREL